MISLYTIWAYSIVAVMAKRMHDKDMSALWLLVFFTAIALPNISTEFSAANTLEGLKIVGLVIKLISFVMLRVYLLPEIALAPIAHVLSVAEFAQQSNAINRAQEPNSINILTGLISFLIWLWFFIQLGLFRGTRGPNRFGPDPLGASKAGTSQ